MAVLCLGLSGFLLFDLIRKIYDGSSPAWLGVAGMAAALVLAIVGRFIKPPKRD